MMQNACERTQVCRSVTHASCAWVANAGKTNAGTTGPVYTASRGPFLAWKHDCTDGGAGEALDGCASGPEPACLCGGRSIAATSACRPELELSQALDDVVTVQDNPAAMHTV